MNKIEKMVEDIIDVVENVELSHKFTQQIIDIARANDKVISSYDVIHGFADTYKLKICDGVDINWVLCPIYGLYINKKPYSKSHFVETLRRLTSPTNILTNLFNEYHDYVKYNKPYIDKNYKEFNVCWGNRLKKVVVDFGGEVIDLIQQDWYGVNLYNVDGESQYMLRIKKSSVENMRLDIWVYKKDEPRINVLNEMYFLEALFEKETLVLDSPTQQRFRVKVSYEKVVTDDEVYYVDAASEEEAINIATKDYETHDIVEVNVSIA